MGMSDRKLMPWSHLASKVYLLEIKRCTVRLLHRLQYSTLELSKDFQEPFSLIGDLNVWDKASYCAKTAKWPFPHQQSPPSYLSVLESAYQSCQTCSIAGRNSRGRIPVSLSKAMTPDSVIRALQQSIHVGKEKQSEAKINKGSRCGLDASNLQPLPSSLHKRQTVINQSGVHL